MAENGQAFYTQELYEAGFSVSQVERAMIQSGHLSGKSYNSDLVRIQVEHQVQVDPISNLCGGIPSVNQLNSSLESDLDFGNLGDSQGSISNMFSNPEDIENARNLNLPGMTLPLGGLMEPPKYVPMPLDKKAILEKEANPTMENWPGDFNFQVLPAPDRPDPSKTNKKCLYSDIAKKLFCDTNVVAPFRISLDFGKPTLPPLNDLIIRVQLVFTDNDLLNVPVQRCSTDIMKEERADDKSNAFRVRHVVRAAAPCSDVMYEYVEATQKCFLLAPMMAPEPGLEYMLRNFTFACRNSCLRESSTSTSKALANTRGLALMFVLFDNSGKMLGRQSVNIRICSAPKRDYNKEEDAIKNPQPSTSSSGKRKSSGGEELASSKVMRDGVRHVVTVPTGLKTEDENVAVCSQDSIYSCTESGSKIKLRSLVHDIAWILKQKSSPNPELRKFANHVYQTLKMIEGLVRHARELDTQPIEETAEESPDGGYHEGQQ